MLRRILLDPQGGEGGSGTVAAAETKAEGAGDRGATLSRAAEGLVAKHGDPTAALLVLLGENYQHRDRIRELTGRLPKDGSVVLEGDDARHWSHYRELGKPSDLKAALGERDTFKAEAGSFRRAETSRAAADIHFPGKARELAILAKDLEITIGDRTDKDGKPVLDKDKLPVKAAFVRGDGDRLIPLDDYARQHWGELARALAPPEERKAVGTPAVQGPRTVPAGSGKAERRAPRSSF